jgi:hypothetical protein
MMTTRIDTTFDFRNFSNDQLHAAGAKVVDLCQKALPPEPSFHRQLVADLMDSVDGIGEALGKAPLTPGGTRRVDLDAERDELYTGFSQFVRSNRRHPDADRAGAADRLMATLGRRPAGFYRLSHDENTSQLTQLFADLDREEAQADLGRLDLVPWYGKLRAANDRFVQFELESAAAQASVAKPKPLAEHKEEYARRMRLLLETLDYQAEFGRQPFADLAVQVDEALAAIRSVSERRTRRKAKRGATSGSGAGPVSMAS